METGADSVSGLEPDPELGLKLEGLKLEERMETSTTLLTDLPENILRGIFQVI